MKSVFVGIAGGTGAGKSSLAFALQDKYPDKIAIVHLDDYFKKSEQAPKLLGMINWDHPDALDFEKMLSDLKELKRGKSITVLTKSEKFNPRYEEVGKIPMEIQPRPIVLVEGYLVLWHPEVRKFLNCSIFLDVEHQIRIVRRTKFQDEFYNENILIPMHEQYVEPTKHFADYIIDIAHSSQKEVLERVDKIIAPLLR